MPHAILLYFDPTTETAIRAVWKELADTSIAPYLHESPNRPHIKLAIFEELRLPEAEARLKAIAAAQSPLPLDFKQIGIFPNLRPTVFLGPAVTAALLDLQSTVDRALCDLGSYPPYDFFRADHWLPHCLLAIDLPPAVIGQPPEQLNNAVAVAMHLALPFQGQAAEIGLIEFHPVKHLLALPFGKISM